jgi:hypothetical protein
MRTSSRGKTFASFICQRKCSQTGQNKQNLTSNRMEIYMETQTELDLNVSPLLTAPTARKTVQGHRCCVIHVERAHVSSRTRTWPGSVRVPAPTKRKKCSPDAGREARNAQDLGVTPPFRQSTAVPRSAQEFWRVLRGAESPPVSAEAAQLAPRFPVLDSEVRENGVGERTCSKVVSVQGTRGG